MQIAAFSVLKTRAVLRLERAIWVSFGVGWDLDPREGSIYDDGGMTMQARF